MDQGLEETRFYRVSLCMGRSPPTTRCRSRLFSNFPSTESHHTVCLILRAVQLTYHPVVHHGKPSYRIDCHFHQCRVRRRVPLDYALPIDSQRSSMFPRWIVAMRLNSQSSTKKTNVMPCILRGCRLILRPRMFSSCLPTSITKSLISSLVKQHLPLAPALHFCARVVGGMYMSPWNTYQIQGASLFPGPPIPQSVLLWCRSTRSILPLSTQRSDCV